MQVLSVSPEGVYRYLPDTDQTSHLAPPLDMTGLADALGVDWVRQARFVFLILWDTEIMPQRTMALYEAGAMVTNGSLMCANLKLPLEWSIIPTFSSIAELDSVIHGRIPICVLGIVEKEERKAGRWQDGSYIGECLEWPRMKVEVSVEEGRIIRIDILDDFGTPEFSAQAKSVIPSRIIEQGTVEVDGVSGATMSSGSLKKAVDDALKKAR
jgi:uncharacterized protein with FMN-binding domain